MGHCSCACRTPSYPAPPMTSPAVTAAAALTANPVPTAAPPLPKKEPSDPGMGTRASDLSAPRWARWRRANAAHSEHSRRCARSWPRSDRGNLPSSWREIANSASPHVSDPSSCSRRARRARKMSVSTALVETSRISAISAYERPSSSRMTSAARWLNARWLSARRMSSPVGRSSSTIVSAMSSWNATSDGRRADWRKRCRQTLCAIAISQF